MKTNPKFNSRGFSLVEIVLALVLFAGVSAAIWRLSGTSHLFNSEATSMAQQNVYSTLRAEIAAQGLNPTTITNFMAPALTDTGGTAVTAVNPASDLRTTGFVRGLVASFESSAMHSATGANRAQPGSASRTAINYQTPSLSLQTSKGIGFGYSIGSTGAVVVAPTPTVLAAPTLNYLGDITSAINSNPLGLNGIITYPTNPAGTTYRYTTDGSSPTIASPLWNNNPSWTVSTFPHLFAIAAFNSDPQWSPSPTKSTTYTYTYTLAANFSRADGRSDHVDFYYTDLQNPGSTGIVLTSSFPGATIIYTLDGTTPSQSHGLVYTGAFAPNSSLFNPSVPLNVFVSYTPSSPDLRYVYNTSVAGYTLNAVTGQLADPIIQTSNSSPVLPGTVVSINPNNALSIAQPITSAGGVPPSNTLYVNVY
jgi:type II secretory pathway pseudopilin PulG